MSKQFLYQGMILIITKIILHHLSFLSTPDMYLLMGDWLFSFVNPSVYKNSNLISRLCIGAMKMKLVMTFTNIYLNKKYVCVCVYCFLNLYIMGLLQLVPAFFLQSGFLILLMFPLSLFKSYTFHRFIHYIPSRTSWSPPCSLTKWILFYHFVNSPGPSVHDCIMPIFFFDVFY